MRRWPAVLLIVALLAGGVVLGDPGEGEGAVAGPDPATLLPVAAPADAQDAAWFCAGQTAGDGTVADGTVVIANVGEEDATGRIDVVGDTGERAGQDVTVAALSTVRVRVADVLEAEWAAVRVETDGGIVVVEHEVVGPLGRDVAPCQTTATSWASFPSGATTRDATLHLAIYNPYPDSATVDIAFTTTDSRWRSPSDFQALPVPSRSLVVVDVTPVVTVVPVAAATVTTRRGRVVVDRIQTYDGEGASTTDEAAEEETHQPRGLTVTPALVEPLPVWAFPVGGHSAVAFERVVVRNTTDQEAEVDVEVALDEPERNGTVGPFPLTVPPGEFAVLPVGEATSVPAGVDHTLVVRSTNGVPVVAERWLDTAGDAASYLGVATSTGAPVMAPRWAFAVGRRDAAVERARVVVVNPGVVEVEVEVVATGGGERIPVPGGSATVAPGGRWQVDLEGLDGPVGSLLVEASGPVVAERRLTAQGTPVTQDGGEQGQGASVALGVPLPSGLRLLP